MLHPAAVLLALTGLPGTGGDFVNWESPHVSPLDLTPDGALLLAVNTADNRLEVFERTEDGLAHRGAVPVGLDPVSVRARTDTEAWVVNHVSDTVSVVDLGAMNVVTTLYPGDEPADVVFAGDPQRAFVSVSRENRLRVYDPLDPAAPPRTVPIAGEDPRALATDGERVYAAIFESGNGTTVIGEDAVSKPALNPYPGDPNPPPNSGAGFSPPFAAGLPPAPAQSLVLKKDAAGVWHDVNGADWSAAVGWDLHDHDVAIVDAAELSVRYATGAMNLDMALAVRPGGGVTVVGTDAINEVRFEPNVRGIFVRAVAAEVGVDGGPARVVDLNPHLDYTVGQLPQSERDRSLGDPRGIAWSASGERAYVTGMGSNNLLVLNRALERVARVEVGEGPTGVRVGRDGRVFVLDRFEAALSVVDARRLVEVARVPFHDPTPSAIRDGRPFLYDTHLTSGLGQASCGSCHVDGRMDQLAWDLGDPQGAVKTLNQPCNDTFMTDCEDWHPVKGPLVTQTLVGIVGASEPFHWRGDREDLAAFNPAFVGLQGDDRELTDVELNRFTAFLATLTPPPNPFRNVDNSLADRLPNGGDPRAGKVLFDTGKLDNAFDCRSCHPEPFGSDGTITSNELDLQAQSMNTPHLLNLYDKDGFQKGSRASNRGFGFAHDGRFESVFEFLGSAFTFPSVQAQRDVEAFSLSFSAVTHAGVGVQAMVPPTPGAPASAEGLVALAAGGPVALVAKGRVANELRGYYLLDAATFQSDRASETVAAPALLGAGSPGAELTFTLVPVGSEVRIGVDRDRDGFFDRDELDAGSDPADPASTPPS